jgi:hypothetical protein
MATVLQLAREMHIKKARILKGFQSGGGTVFARSDAIALGDFHAFLISYNTVMRYNAGKTGRLKSSIRAVLEGRDAEFFFAVSAAG